MKQEEYDNMTLKQQEKAWLKSIRNVNLSNWERSFDLLNTLEFRKLPEKEMTVIKKRYQKGINKFFKPFIKSLIKSLTKKSTINRLKQKNKNVN